MAKKDVDGNTTPLYTFFDLSDAIFAFIGLFVIGFAFLQIANFGMKLWKEDMKNA